jgi:hypothetical protein
MSAIITVYFGIKYMAYPPRVRETMRTVAKLLRNYCEIIAKLFRKANH